MEVRTVNEAWALYAQMILASCKKPSQDSERGRWENYISPILGTKNIIDITTFDYLTLKQSLQSYGLSQQTVHHCLSLLRRVLNRAIEWGNINFHVPKFTGIMPKFDNKRMRYLTREEAKELLDTLKKVDKSGEWHDIALFALNTGLRKSEIFNITLNDVNFDAGHFVVTETKSYKNRIISMNQICHDIMIKKNSLRTKTGLPV